MRLRSTERSANATACVHCETGQRTTDITNRIGAGTDFAILPLRILLGVTDKTEGHISSVYLIDCRMIHPFDNLFLILSVEPEFLIVSIPVYQKTACDYDSCRDRDPELNSMQTENP